MQGVGTILTPQDNEQNLNLMIEDKKRKRWFLHPSQPDILGNNSSKNEDSIRFGLVFSIQ